MSLTQEAAIISAQTLGLESTITTSPIDGDLEFDFDTGDPLENAMQTFSQLFFPGTTQVYRRTHSDDFESRKAEHPFILNATAAIDIAFFLGIDIATNLLGIYLALKDSQWEKYAAVRGLSNAATNTFLTTSYGVFDKAVTRLRGQN